MSLLRWTRKSTRTIAQESNRLGHCVIPNIQAGRPPADALNGFRIVTESITCPSRMSSE